MFTIESVRFMLKDSLQDYADIVQYIRFLIIFSTKKKLTTVLDHSGYDRNQSKYRQLRVSVRQFFHFKVLLFLIFKFLTSSK